MQVTPALPWTDQTEGGVIKLAQPVTMTQIIYNGALEFVLADDTNGAIVTRATEGNDGLRIIDGSQRIVYTIARWDEASDELVITRDSNAPTGIHLMAVVKPSSETVQVVPALPFAPTSLDEKGAVIISPAKTPDEIAGGILKIKYANRSTPTDLNDAVLTASVMTIYVKAGAVTIAEMNPTSGGTGMQRSWILNMLGSLDWEIVEISYE